MREYALCLLFFEEPGTHKAVFRLFAHTADDAVTQAFNDERLRNSKLLHIFPVPSVSTPDDKKAFDEIVNEIGRLGFAFPSKVGEPV